MILRYVCFYFVAGLAACLCARGCACLVHVRRVVLMPRVPADAVNSTQGRLSLCV